MTGKEIYFVLGNSRDPCGQQDFINGLRNIFDKTIYKSYGLDWPRHLESTVTLSQKIIPGEINIFMEDFSCNFAKHLIDVKRKNPRTQYVIILTEFPTVSESGYLSFNSFTRDEQLWSMVVRIQHIGTICSTDQEKSFALLTRGLNLGNDNHGQASRNSLWRWVFLSRMRSVIRFVLSLRYVFSLVRHCLSDVSRLNDRLTYEKRLASLLDIRDEVSLFLITHRELRHMYDRLSFGPIQEFPLLFSPTPIENISNRPKSIFFSGNLTKYRENVLGAFREVLVGPYRQYQYIEDVVNLFFEYFASQSFDSEKLKFLLDDGLSVYISPEKVIGPFLETGKNGNHVPINIERIDEFISAFRSHYPPIMIIGYAYANWCSIKALPRYEIYVPQANNWKWSSPVRTFRSLYHGLHPVNLGDFSDHEIVSVASQAKDEEGLRKLLNDGNNNDELLTRVRHYHEEIYTKAIGVASCLLALAGEKTERTETIG